MDYFAQQLINGITLGSIYGLIAIGYTMVFGIIGMVNFAHGVIDPHFVAGHCFGGVGAIHRARRRDVVHFIGQLDD